MATDYIYITLILFGNLFFQNFAQARNDSDIAVEQIENASHSHNTNLSYEEINKVGFENKSYYEWDCDCGWQAKKCWYDAFKEKHCECNEKYSQKGGKCEECDCGWGSRTTGGCEYNEFQEKVCKCQRDYSQNGDKCERCNCGFLSSKCSFENNKKICSCYGDYKQNRYGECAECDCGYDAINCEFSGSDKVCTCKSGYIVEYGKCVKCDCGYMATSCDLTYDKYTRCTCKPGYVAERTTWYMNEKCELPGPSGWKIATYIESVIFAIIILICICSICSKKISS